MSTRHTEGIIGHERLAAHPDGVLVDHVFVVLAAPLHVAQISTQGF